MTWRFMQRGMSRVELAFYNLKRSNFCLRSFNPEQKKINYVIFHRKVFTAYNKLPDLPLATYVFNPILSIFRGLFRSFNFDSGIWDGSESWNTPWRGGHSLSTWRGLFLTPISSNHQSPSSTLYVHHRPRVRPRLIPRHLKENTPYLTRISLRSYH